ncbi:piggyBac transposable element-derived protein 4-like [Macrobrachium rosenbergii]|uniref:piggyBac transposable element-derived protein 4-like n=1 Tax=Macrobrachium rosenbergii TaxID=79674 RepID=UPI0034D68C83
MNATKRRRISSGEINQILDEVSDTEDIFDDESSSSESSSDEDIEETNFSSDSGSADDFSLPSDWTPRGREKDPFTFVADPGMKFSVEDKENPLEYFEKYFDDEVIDYLIMKETNRYANQFLDENVEHLSPQSRVHRWFDTCAREMKVFIGLLILQGIDSKCDNSMYFSTRESVSSPFFRKVMSGRRFDLLHKFLHLVDNSTITEGPGRKLAKIKPFTDLILKKFMNNYIPRRNVSVDESLLGWKGNLSWVQYIPAKRKRAIVLYTDNFYKSPTLADALADEETDTVGTVRVTRKDVPAKIKETKLKKGEKVAEFRKKSMVLKWKDKKDVCVLSTMHDDSMVKVKSRRGKKMYKPKAVADYNANMGGVHLSDNLLVLFSTARNRLKKYYKKVFRHLLDMSVVNCYVTYRALGGRVVRREFILRISERLIMKYAEERSVPLRRPPRLAAKPSRLIGRHFPEYCPPTDKKKRPQRTCAQCRKNNIRKDSSYWCKDCEVGLCVAPCFRDWHTKE